MLTTWYNSMVLLKSRSHAKQEYHLDSYKMETQHHPTNPIKEGNRSEVFHFTLVPAEDILACSSLGWQRCCQVKSSANIRCNTMYRWRLHFYYGTGFLCFLLLETKRKIIYLHFSISFPIFSNHRYPTNICTAMADFKQFSRKRDYVDNNSYSENKTVHNWLFKRQCYIAI